jgi:hypothetical protein
VIPLGISFVTALDGKAKGESGGVSIFPGFPLIGLVSWGTIVILNYIKKDLGAYLIGGLNILLFIAFLISILKSLILIKKRKSNFKSS